MCVCVCFHRVLFSGAGVKIKHGENGSGSPTLTPTHLKVSGLASLYAKPLKNANSRG